MKGLQYLILMNKQKILDKSLFKISILVKVQPTTYKHCYISLLYFSGLDTNSLTASV